MGKAEIKAKASKWKITNNLGLKIASFLLAILVWLMVVNMGDPVTTKVFKNVPVTVLHEEFLTEESQVYQVLESTDLVDITVRARRSVLKEIKESDFTVTADMRELVHMKSVRIAVTCEKYADKIEDLVQSHNTLLVSIEELVNKELAVELETIGTPAEGYTVGKYTINPSTVVLSGPASKVKKVERAVLAMNIESATALIEGEGSIILYDAQGNVVTDESLSLNNSRCSAHIPVWQTKSVAVEVIPTGEVASGYSYDNVSCYPTAVTITGEKEILDSMSKIAIPEGIIDISGATETLEKVINIEEYLPEGIYLVEDNSAKIKVTVEVSRQTTRQYRLNVDQIGFRNTPEDYKVGFGGVTEFTVTLRGPAKEVEQVKESDIKCTANLNNLGLGQHQVPLEIVVSGNVEAVDQVLVTVYLEAKTVSTAASGTTTLDGTTANTQPTTQ